MERTLEDIYFSVKNPGSLGGVYRLYKEAQKLHPNISFKKVDSWIKKQNVYNMFKEVRKPYPRLPIIVSNIDEQWQMDLMDMSWVSRENSGFKYILNIIDCFSRYVWAKALKSKKATEIVDALENVFAEGRIPQKIQSDQGTEFKNESIKKLLQRMNIKFFYATDGEIKCAIVERFNRTLRNRLYRYLSYKNTHKYIDVLEDIIEAYNQSYHRIIQMSPSEVNESNRIEVLSNIRKSHPVVKDRRKPYSVGEKVRITRDKAKFEKGATSTFTEEIFKVKKVKKTPQGYIYRLTDYEGEPITSIFYHSQLVHAEEPDLLQVKVLKTRTNPKTKKKEYFVKWIGYPDKFNSWVKDVESI